MGNREQRRATPALAKKQVMRADRTVLAMILLLLTTFVAVTLTAPAAPPSALAGMRKQRHPFDKDGLYQKDISAARIVVLNERHYAVDVAASEADFLQMNRKSGSLNAGGVPQIQGSILEDDVGRFFFERIAIREEDGTPCSGRMLRVGLDPIDGGVWASLTFECITKVVTYDANAFLAAHGRRAWQIVALHEGDASRQIWVNAESERIPIPSYNSQPLATPMPSD